MPDEEVVLPLRGYRIHAIPGSPTLGLLRMYTEQSEFRCLVTREILAELGGKLAEEAQLIEPMQ